MPTGYTADVADGKVTDFATFALRCARAFGATIMQRDNPMDEPPQLREASDYYAKSVERNRARIAELDAMTAADAERAAQAEYDSNLASYHATIELETATRNRYNAMLAQVMAWQPPTPDHNGLKTFMVEQIAESRRYDYEPEPPKKLGGDLWLASNKAAARDSLARSEKSLAEELERCEGANRWITALYESLSATVPA